MADIQMGKYVSMLLRHRPQEAGVVLDEHGWTDVADLVAKVKPKYPDISEELLHEMAFAPDKQRYEFSEDNKRIRAVHGHSVSVDLGYEAKEPPAILYHGSAEKFRKGIEKEGLIKKSRQFVHLSENIKAAKEVGRRHGKLVLYEIAAKQMYDAGFVFYRSTSGVRLTDNVPLEFMKEISSV